MKERRAFVNVARFVYLYTLLTSCFFIGQIGGISSEQPNIILIMVDDVGWNDFSFHGSNEIPTPNIDALAYNGVILNKFYTHHICTPSRAALLTGKHPIRTGMQGSPIAAGDSRALPRDVVTLAQRLKDLNYSTHLVGKWHLGAAYRKDTPTQRGFDTHFGYWHGFVGYFNYIQQQEAEDGSVLRGLDLHDGFEPLYNYDGKYATETITQKSLELIENHDRQKPLFLMVSHLAGHTGDNGTELGVPDRGATDKKYAYIEHPERRLYADVINHVDISVGKIVDKLSKTGMLEKSVILFLSDNGAPIVGMYHNHGSNWPFRGMKMTLFEGGVRGTGIIFSPQFKKQAYINNALIHITDIMPSLYHAAGGKYQDLGDIDGVNQWPTLSENTPSARENILLNIDEVLNFSGLIGHNGRYKLLNGSFESDENDKFFEGSGRYNNVPMYDENDILHSQVNKAVLTLENYPKLTYEQIRKKRQQLDMKDCRKKDVKPKSCTNEEMCLFDLMKDPCETRNLATELPAVAEELKKELQSYYDQLIPQKKKLVELQANPIYYNGTWCTWLDDKDCPKTEHELNIFQYIMNKLCLFYFFFLWGAGRLQHGNICCNGLSTDSNTFITGFQA